MRYMLMKRASRHSEAGVAASRLSIESWNAYHEELKEAGILVAAEQLHASSGGMRIAYPATGAKPVYTAGPWSKASETIAGYLLIEVASEREAVEWAKRAPDPNGYGEGVIELRRIKEDEEA
jgi:hypothetical protein